MAATLRDVSLRLGNRWVLIHVDAEIPDGTAVLLTGENGAGKTTLLRVMATALRPTRGVVELFGRPAHEDLDAARRKVGIVTHMSHLYYDLSALENLQLVASLTGREGEDLMGILERVSLQEHAHRRVRHFSAGMKRRLCIGRVLLRRPSLALLDEPFGALDPEGVALMEEIVLQLRDEGTTLVFSTHDHERGRRICNYHLELSQGRPQGGLQKIEGAA